MKNFLIKLKQVSIGASPIIIIILAVHFFISPMETSVLVPFIISCFMLVLGQALFLVGVDSSILTMGELVGGNIRKLNKLWLILLFGFLFGTMATVAEPAVNVVSRQVNMVNSGIDPTLLTWVVSSGIGIFVAYGLFRIFKSISIKWSFAIAYLITFILILLTPKEFQAIAFDFSGATTGVITVPFILALGVGVTAVLGKKDQGDSYGLIGLASIGPIITMCIMGIVFGGGEGGLMPEAANPQFVSTLLSSIQNIVIALLPITVVFFLFNFLFIKLPKKKILRTLYGICITIAGLTLFLTAVNFGFSAAGRHIGEAFTSSGKEWFKYLLIPFGFILGFAITYTEVAIRVLAIQIEENTNGKIKKGILILTLALGLAVTVTFGMLRILFEINILWFLIPIFAIGIICMPFISRMFVGIAFDSGGVASGTITAAFLVPFAIGAVSGIDPNANFLIYGFGMISFIAAIPIIAISVLGLVYQLKLKKTDRVYANKPVPVINIANCLIGIITRPEKEHEIHGRLRSLNARIVTTFSARGLSKQHPASPFSLSDEQKIFLLGMISKANAEKMIEILENEFDFKKENAGVGIAFTLPLDKIEI